MKPLLEIDGLSVSFRTYRGVLEGLHDVSWQVYPGETVGIVGESGCGKSITAQSAMKLLPEETAMYTNGHIYWDGRDILPLREKEMNALRGRQMAMVFQDPMTSLNPVLTIGSQIREGLDAAKFNSRRERDERALALLQAVGITNPEKRLGQYPHELSGGMRQRCLIAMALAGEPRLLFADEPTTALDVTIQAQILDLIRSLQKELNMTVVYITHDLGVVANVADRVAVMYAGQIVEYGMVEEIFYDAWHPYTWALLSALPQLGVKGEALPTIDGTPPNLFNEVKGDAFAPRNKRALAIDFVEEPPFFEVSPTHKAKTWYLDPRAPKIEQPDSIRRLREQMKLKERG